MSWLIEDIVLKSWWHGGGKEGELIMKSDGEPAIIALKEAVMKYHGGIMIPEVPARAENQIMGSSERPWKLSSVRVHGHIPDRREGWVKFANRM